MIVDIYLDSDCIIHRAIINYWIASLPGIAQTSRASVSIGEKGWKGKWSGEQPRVARRK